MLKVSIDYGNAFDMLVILNVKLAKTNGRIKTKNIENFELLAAEIKSQIGEYLFNKIISSDEYKELYQVNLDIFNSIDLAKSDTGLAKKTDVLNYDRFLKKKELQAKFFEDEMTEMKIGYENS